MADTTYRSGKNKILLGQANNSLVLLFAVNMLFFVAMHMISIIYQLSDVPDESFRTQVLNWLILPASGDVLAARPWTLLVHMFMHFGFWHLVSSMLWLWFFGYLLQDLLGNNRLIPAYLYSGLSGAVVFLLAANFLPGTPAPALMGASQAVMGIAVAITLIAPGYRFFPLIGGGIPLWVITLIYAAFDIATIGPGNSAIMLSHLAAALTGFLFAHQLQRGRDWGAWMNRLAERADDLFNPEKKHADNNSSQRLYYRADRKPFEKRANVTQRKLDDILEKIHRDGYDRLSHDEKDFLNRASKEDL